MNAAQDTFRIAADHACLPGHFPGNPLVPGVVILDRVVAALEARHGLLGALRFPQVKFVQPLRPDETARIALESLPGATSRWRFRVERDDVLLASGEVATDGVARA